MSAHVLDRPVWTSLATEHARFALGDDRARRLAPALGPFAAARDDDPESLAALSALASVDGPLVLLQADPIALPPRLAAAMTAEGVQMIYAERVAPRAPAIDVPLERLTAADAPAMVALAAMTWSPGLFVLGLVAQGAGHGLSQPSITAAIARSVEESDLGIAAAANRLMGQGGAAFGITVLTLAYGGDARPEAFAFAFATGAGLSALSVAAATFMGIQVVHPGHASPRESDARSTSSPR